MTQTQHDDTQPDQQPKASAGRYWLGVITEETTDPLQMVGAALTGLLEVVTEQVESAGFDDDLERENRELDQRCD